jgi:hypothetical protein
MVAAGDGGPRQGGAGAAHVLTLDTSGMLTFDLRHFPVVAREGTIRLVGFEEE